MLRFMKIEYTDYAEMKISKRNLSKNQIENVVKNSDKISEGKKGRKISQKLEGRYLLRVVFEQYGNTHKVIMAYYSEPERYR